MAVEGFDFVHVAEQIDVILTESEEERLQMRAYEIWQLRRQHPCPRLLFRPDGAPIGKFS